MVSIFLAASGLSAAAEENMSRPVEQAQGGYIQPKPKEGFRYPECFCTDSMGRRVEIGETSCIQIGSTSYLAQCGMSLNNPAWRRVSDSCPSV